MLGPSAYPPRFLGRTAGDGKGQEVREQLEQRLSSLKREYHDGQTAIADLQAKMSALQATMLRISGAIQVLEEELATSTPERTQEEESLH